MESWQQRVITEKKDLDEKRCKLDCYLDSHEDSLLTEQLEIMGQYAIILGKRIKTFAEDIKPVNAAKILDQWCLCTKLEGVARDGKSTCSICGGIDAYGTSKDRPELYNKTLIK